MNTDFYNRNMFYGADSGTLRAAAILRKNMTLSERILWKKLRDKKIFKPKFRRQHPVDIFIVDFYCHEFKLVIEIDGEVHNNNESREYDLNRTAQLEKYGIRVIRFTNDQIFCELERVTYRIIEAVTESTPL
jgi:very-short-patch-repair endonuclease